MLTKKNLLIGGIIIFIFAVIYVFSGNDSGGQTGFDAIKAGISNSLTKQRAVSDKLDDLGTGLDVSSGTTESIENSNNAAKTAIDSAQNTIKGSNNLIEDSRVRLERCQQIIGRMEERAGQRVGPSQAGS